MYLFSSNCKLNTFDISTVHFLDICICFKMKAALSYLQQKTRIISFFYYFFFLFVLVCFYRGDLCLDTLSSLEIKGNAIYLYSQSQMQTLCAPGRVPGESPELSYLGSR